MSSTFDGRADRACQPCQRWIDSARHAEGGACARGAARHFDRRIDRVGRAGGRVVHERHAADGRCHPDPRRVCPCPVGEHRAARAHVPREHAEEHLRARTHAGHSDLADARALPGRADHWAWGGARRSHQLSGEQPRPRARAALELSGRAHALDADHPTAGGSRPQARATGALDAVPDGRRVLRGGHSP